MSTRRKSDDRQSAFTLRAKTICYLFGVYVFVKFVTYREVTMLQLLTIYLAGCMALAPKSEFLPFGLCFQSLPAAEQVKLCQLNGFTSLGIGFAGGDTPDLKEFAVLPDVKSGRFHVRSLLWWTKADMDLNGPEGAWLDKTLVQAARMGTALWMVSDGQRDDRKTHQAMIQNLTEVARRCRKNHVQLVLYPHMGCVYETAEEGVTVLKELRQLGYPEVKTSIHLCHELKAGNGARIAEVVAHVAPYLALASVSGGDSDTRSKGGWESAIKPLGEGSYDPLPFINALKSSGYTGPIELHTYALPDPRKDNHIARSLRWWRDHIR